MSNTAVLQLLEGHAALAKCQTEVKQVTSRPCAEDVYRGLGNIGLTWTLFCCVEHQVKDEEEQMQNTLSSLGMKAKKGQNAALSLSKEKGSRTQDITSISKPHKTLLLP